MENNIDCILNELYTLKDVVDGLRSTAIRLDSGVDVIEPLTIIKLGLDAIIIRYDNLDVTN